MTNALHLVCAYVLREELQISSLFKQKVKWLFSFQPQSLTVCFTELISVSLSCLIKTADKVTCILQNHTVHHVNTLQWKVTFVIRIASETLDRSTVHLHVYRSTDLTTASLGNLVRQRWEGGSEYSTLKAEPQKFALHNMISLNIHTLITRSLLC